MNNLRVNKITGLSVFTKEILNLIIRNHIFFTQSGSYFIQSFTLRINLRWNESGMHMQGCFHILFLFVSAFHSKETACSVCLVICFHSDRHFCKQELKCVVLPVRKFLSISCQLLNILNSDWCCGISEACRNKTLPHKIRL